MRVKTINLSLPEELLALLDAQARREYASRSECVKRAIMAYLKAESAFDLSALTRTAEDVQREKLRAFLKEYEEKGYIDDVDDGYEEEK